MSQFAQNPAEKYAEPKNAEVLGLLVMFFVCCNFLFIIVQAKQIVY